MAKRRYFHFVFHAYNNPIYTLAVPRYWFHQLLRDISIIINTFSPKLYSFTRMKKNPDYVLKRSLYRFRFQHTIKHSKSTDILHCKKHKSSPDDNVKKNCEMSRLLPGGDNM